MQVSLCSAFSTWQGRWPKGARPPQPRLGRRQGFREVPAGCTTEGLLSSDGHCVPPGVEHPEGQPCCPGLWVNRPLLALTQTLQGHEKHPLLSPSAVLTSAGTDPPPGQLPAPSSPLGPDRVATPPPEPREAAKALKISPHSAGLAHGSLGAAVPSMTPRTEAESRSATLLPPALWRACPGT